MQTPTKKMFSSIQGNTTAQLVKQNIDDAMGNDTLDVIKQYLFQMSQEKMAKNGIQPTEDCENHYVTERMLDNLKYNNKNKLLSMVDAKMKDH